MNKTPLLLVLLLTSCFTYDTNYILDLHDVQENGQPRSYTETTYQNENMTFEWVVRKKGFDVTLKNESRETIKILWDQTVYIDENGVSHRVMHNGVKFSDRNALQPPSIIPSGATTEDHITPTHKIQISDNGWTSDNLFPVYFKSLKELKATSEDMKGKKVSIFMPIQVGQVTTEYLFTFEITDWYD